MHTQETYPSSFTDEEWARIEPILRDRAKVPRQVERHRSGLWIKGDLDRAEKPGGIQFGFFRRPRGGKLGRERRMSQREDAAAHRELQDGVESVRHDFYGTNLLSPSSARRRADGC